jgi:hypothetical protein
MSSRSRKRVLIGTVLSLFLFTSQSNALSELRSAPIASPDDLSNGLDENSVSNQLKLFRSAEVSLRQILMDAGRLHAGARVLDASFDGGSGIPLYHVKAYRLKRLWEDAIDARTGDTVGESIESSLTDLSKEDRRVVRGLEAVRPNLFDAVIVAERNLSGKAISAGLMIEHGRLNFVIVLISGQNIRQMMLEPPTLNSRDLARHAINSRPHQRRPPH